jgi:hypothetical protein
MDRILFGDNQFFGVNHMSEERARKQSIRFKDTRAIIDVLDYVYDIGLRTFMCTTHDRMAEVCDHFRAHADRYEGFRMYPCLPYGHKYNNAVAELGVLGAIKASLPGSVVGSIARGGVALARRSYVSMMKLLVDAELNMFDGIETGVIFLQNVATDLLLGLGMTDFFVAFADYVAERYDAEPGFITMNFPTLLPVLEECGIKNPIICTSINKAGFRMPGGKPLYEATAAEGRCRLIAMQTLAAGAISPGEAMEYVCTQKGIHSVLYGASTRAHIKETKELVEALWQPAGSKTHEAGRDADTAAN